jgi:hypothetical protein
MDFAQSKQILRLTSHIHPDKLSEKAGAHASDRNQGCELYPTTVRTYLSSEARFKPQAPLSYPVNI